MALEYYASIDLNKNELQNAVIHPLGSAPSSPTEGQIYYDSTGGDKQIYVYNGSAWTSLGGSNFSTIAVSGQTDVVADTGGDTLTLAAGSNVTITTNASTDTVTIASTNTTYSAATSSTLGLIKLEDDTVQSVAANGVTATASRTYGIQVNSSGQAVVNVPWTDQLTQEQVEDYAGNLITVGGTKTGITITYDDANNDMDFVVSDLTVAGDTGSTGMTPGDTLTVAGGEGIDTSMSGDTLTISGENATTTNKGIASFSSADFTVSSGAVSISSGAVSNSQLANSSITIGDSTISLGGTDTTLTGLTDIDLTAGAKTIFDGVGANNLTIGAASTTIVIPGDLQVTGTTTTSNVETVSTSNGVVFEGSVADANELTLLAGSLSADRTATLADLTGYVAIFASTPSTTITATPAELNYVDGVTSNIQTQLNNKVGSLSDLGITATAAEINTLDGITATTAELNLLDGITTLSGSNTGDEPDASTTTKGIIEIATNTETQTGTDTSRAITAAGLASRTVTATIDVSNTTFISNNFAEITHNLGTEDVIVQLFDSSTKQTVYADVSRTDKLNVASTSKIKVSFGIPPANDIEVLITSIKGASSGTIAYS
jgi:hypothetical protein